MTSQTLQDFLGKLNKAPQANNVYIAFDDSNGVSQDQYNLVKIIIKIFLKLIFSLKTSFFKTSVIKYDNTIVDVLLDQIKLEPVDTAINQLVQRRGGAANFVAAMNRIAALSAQVQGNKALFLFTTGNAIDKNKIHELIGKGFEIFCFLILENGQAQKTNLETIFGNQKVMLLPNIPSAQDCFDGLVIASGDAPKISIKNVDALTATFTITGIDDYSDVEFVIKKGPSFSTSDKQVLKNSKEITIDLKPEFPKSKITVQGIKSNQLSQVSNELVVALVEKHPTTEKIQTPNYLQNLRKRILTTRVPELLRSVGIDTFNFSLFGDMGNGKSSVSNTLLTALEQELQDKILFPAPIGRGQSTLTKEIKKYLLTSALKQFDCPGLQSNDNSNAEIDSLAQGRLLHNFQQGGGLNEDNKRFKNEMNLKGAPHLFIYVVDIETAMNDDSIRRFGELSKLLKQKYNLQILICLTKLDQLQENNSPVLDKSEFGQALENGVVKKFIQDYARKADISVDDIFPIFNYTGPLERRSKVKDAYALILLDYAIHAITTYFKRYVIVRIIDQNKKEQGSFLIESLEIYLEQFYSDYRTKVSHLGFKMGGFYQKEKDNTVSDGLWKATLLSDIIFNEEIVEGFQICTLKLQNDIPSAVPTP